MIPIVKADGTVELEFIRQLKKRSGEVDEKVNQAVAQIIAQVKERGDEAVREYTVKFDGRAPENLEISKKELKEAENSRAPELLDALRRAAENIADFHRRQVQQSWLETKRPPSASSRAEKSTSIRSLPQPGFPPRALPLR